MRVGLRVLGLALPLIIAAAANVGFYVPRTPEGVSGITIPGADKLVHAGVFALTVWALARVLARRGQDPLRWVLAVALAHAVLIEAVQGVALPGRSASAGDVIADAVGIGIGAAAWIRERSTERGRSPRAVSPAASRSRRSTPHASPR